MAGQWSSPSTRPRWGESQSEPSDSAHWQSAMPGFAHSSATHAATGTAAGGPGAARGGNQPKRWASPAAPRRSAKTRPEAPRRSPCAGGLPEASRGALRSRTPSRSGSCEGGRAGEGVGSAAAASPAGAPRRAGACPRSSNPTRRAPAWRSRACHPREPQGAKYRPHTLLAGALLAPASSALVAAVAAAVKLREVHGALRRGSRHTAPNDEPRYA